MRKNKVVRFRVDVATYEKTQGFPRGQISRELRRFLVEFVGLRKAQTVIHTNTRKNYL